MKKPYIPLYFLLIPLLILSPFVVFAQGFYTNFGQNRVQYDNFIWSYYESENFITYFYQGGYDIAKFTATVAENSLSDIETKLEFKNSSKVEIMVYHTLSDLKQTNIGTGIETNNTGGVTKIIGNKIFVYFDGNYQHLEAQVREGISRVSMERMVFGTNIQEILQNAVLLNLPDWYTNGLVSYIGTNWSTELDNRLRQEILSNNFDNFNKLSGERATLAGHALWHYIELMHGQVAIPNLLYLTRVNRSIESAFVFVLGNNINGTIEDFNEYYKNLYKSEASNRQAIAPDSSLLHIKRKNDIRNGQVVGQVRISPNGKYIAYTTNEIGRQLTWLYDTKTQTRKRLVANGFKSYKQPWEENYPLLAWDADSRQLAIVYERRDKTVFTIYRPESGEKVRNPEITKFQQVNSMDFVNSRQLVFSAIQAGQVDLFLYDIPNTKTTRLTNDFYPDLQPRFVHLADGKKGIAFASNRPTDTLKVEKLGVIMPTATYDLFFYDLKRITPPTEEGQTALLVRLTNTPLANETYPTPYDTLHVAYLSDENGINNQYVSYLDSSLLRIDQRYIFRDSMMLNPTYPAEKISEWRTKGLLERIELDTIYKIFGKSFAISNYNKGILQADVATLANTLVTLHFENARYKLTLQPIAPQPRALPTLENTSYRNQMDKLAQLKAAKAKAANLPKTTNKKTNIVIDIPDPLPISPNPTKEPSNAEPIPPTPNNNETIDIDNYSFQTEFDVIDKTPQTPSNADTPPQVGSPIATTTIKNSSNSAIPNDQGSREFFKRTDIRSYLLQFGIDNIATQVDNSVMFTAYQPYNGTGNFLNPDLSGAFKVGCTDLFENYRIMGGFRLPLGLNGMEYFLQYDNVKKRLDKRFLFYRGATTNSVTADNGTPLGVVVPLKEITHLAEFTLSYPFDTYRSLRLTTGYRNDKAIFKSIDIPTLLAPSYTDNWANLKLEYVFDNTINTGLNLLNGTRAKSYIDLRKQFNGIINTNQFELGFKNTNFVGIVGVDIRHYQKIHRQVILATRFAGAHSFGNAKILYYLGGPENWLVIDQNKKFEQTNPVDQTESYGFQALATNMRGFKQNVRNGTSYFVLNTELRVPVFTYLLNTQIGSELIKNFQLIAFADLGSAWMGISPFDERSQYTIITNNNNPAISTTTKYFRNPIVGSYGWGARTKLLGYFVRMDVGWGIDTGVRNKALWQFSLGMDF